MIRAVVFSATLTVAVVARGAHASRAALRRVGLALVNNRRNRHEPARRIYVEFSAVMDPQKFRPEIFPGISDVRTRSRAKRKLETA